VNKGELVDALAASTGQSKKVVGDVLESLIDNVQKEVKAGNKVSLPGFGTFERRHRNARTGRNPQTGAAIQVAAAEVPAFKPGASFKSFVNG
jgi:DNA-binding protein HU-beta